MTSLAFFIWFEPVAVFLEIFLGLLLLTTIITFSGLIVFGLETKEEEKRKNIFILAKRMVIFSVFLVLSISISIPLSNFTSLWKKALIYKGIDAALVEQRLDTAERVEKMIDERIEEELKK